MDADLFLQQFGHLAQGEGGIKKLRDVIRVLAIQGRLLDSEGIPPLNKELQKISVKKGAYPLPKNWQWIPIGNLMNLINGKAFKQSEWGNEGLPIIRIQNLNNELASFNFCNSDVESKFIVENGTLLISWSGTPGTSFGAFIWNRGKALLNQHIFKVEILFNELSKEYLRLAVNGRLDEMISKAHGGVGLRHITKGKLEAMTLPIPPLAEQNRIVAKVDELMALCDKLEAERKAQRTLKTQTVQSTLHHLTSADSPASFGTSLNIIERTFGNWFDDLATVKHLRATILQLAVQGKLVPQNSADEPASVLLKRIDAEKKRLVKEGIIKKQKPTEVISDMPCDLPQQWQWSRLGDLCTLITDGTHHTPTYIDSGIPFISVKDIDGRTVSFKNCKYISKEQHDEINQRCNPEEGDILICRIGTIGRVTIVDTKDPFSLFVSVGLIKFVQHLYTPRFAHLVMSSPLLTTQYQQIKAGGSHTNKLNLIDLPKLLLPVASIAEQKRIVAKVDELMTLCDQLEAHISHTQTLNTHLMDSLIHRMTEAA